MGLRGSDELMGLQLQKSRGEPEKSDRELWWTNGKRGPARAILWGGASCGDVHACCGGLTYVGAALADTRGLPGR